MCIFGNNKTKPLAKEPAPPEQTADATEVGATRKKEDDALFGGVPDLRVDRTVAQGGNATGTGLKVM